MHKSTTLNIKSKLKLYTGSGEVIGSLSFNCFGEADS